MTREKLEKYLGEKVKVILFNGTKLEGYLRKTGTPDYVYNPDLFIPKKRYFLTDGRRVIGEQLFRVSHIKKLEVID